MYHEKLIIFRQLIILPFRPFQHLLPMLFSQSASSGKLGVNFTVEYSHVYTRRSSKIDQDAEWVRRGGNRFVCLSDPSIGHVARGASWRTKGAAARASGATSGYDIPSQQQRQRLLQRAPGAARRRLQRRRGVKVSPKPTPQAAKSSLLFVCVTLVRLPHVLHVNCKLHKLCIENERLRARMRKDVILLILSENNVGATINYGIIQLWLNLSIQ